MTPPHPHDEEHKNPMACTDTPSIDAKNTGTGTGTGRGTGTGTGGPVGAPVSDALGAAGMASTPSAAEITALSHLYRGEMHRAAFWRGRLDTTTNWAVVTTGIALSVAFSNAATPPLPIVLVSLLLLVFLVLESRRYMYFDVSFTRLRTLEARFFTPILLGQPPQLEPSWTGTLGEAYVDPHFRMSLLSALRERLRRNYIWIFAVQVAAYWGKLVVHPTPARSFADLVERSTIGSLSGTFVMLFGALFYTVMIGLALAPRDWVARLSFRPKVCEDAERAMLDRIVHNDPH